MVATKTKLKHTQPKTDSFSEADSPDLVINPKKSREINLELDDVETTTSVIDEKVAIEDPLAPIDIEDDEVSEMGLDAEDLNPFGDRWEE